MQSSAPAIGKISPPVYWKSARKVVCIGRNYADHIAELGNQRPSKPFYFLKPSSSILPPTQLQNSVVVPQSSPVLIPNGANVHYEVELAVIMGRRVSDLAYQKNLISAEEYETLWMNSIFGYSIGIDLTSRNMQDEVKKAGLPWSAAKGYDTYLPLSKFIPKERIPDPHNVRLELKVNGDTVQDDNTNLMLFKIPELLEAITDVMALQKGDLVLTGTPKGVGQVVGGDVMKASCYVGDDLIESFEVSVADRKHPDGTPW